MNLEAIKLSKSTRRWRPRIMWSHSHEMSRRGKSAERERGCQELDRGAMGVTANGYRISFRSDENDVEWGSGDGFWEHEKPELYTLKCEYCGMWIMSPFFKRWGCSIGLRRQAVFNHSHTLCHEQTHHPVVDNTYKLFHPGTVVSSYLMGIH